MSEKDPPPYHLPPVDNHRRQREPFPSMANSTMGGVTAPILPPTRFTDDTLMYVVVKVRNEDERAKRHSSVDHES
jgi:hypothetical protein